jgi:sterol desaturase/sphingolipid hydroxylase (fatty acid hydroxylase superfamily)
MLTALHGGYEANLGVTVVTIVLEMILKAVLLIEVVGYVYHRFLQHLGLFTRLGYAFRRNQKYHWNHHNVRYPVGRFYKRPVKYSPSEQGFSWGWAVPGTILASLYLFCYGIHLPSISFVAGMAAYAKLVVDKVHQRFHEGLNSEGNGAYFRWLDKVHLLHHFDQRCNFTIVHPLMDFLFGTYKKPGKHADELAIAVDESRAIVSDLINWSYMLMEANPTEYAVFVSAVRKHSRLRGKLMKVVDVLNERLSFCAQDKRARTLRDRAIDLLNATALQ